MEALRTFAASGYTHQGGDGSWTLTDLALNNICTGTAYQRVGDPYALSADVGTKAVQDCSNYELLKLLHLAGWRRQALPQKARRLQCQPILRDGVLQKKVYYGSFHRKYAEVLLTCTRDPIFFVQHGILNIRHFLPETTYDLLLKGTDFACFDNDDADDLQDDLAGHEPQDYWEDEPVTAATEPHDGPYPEQDHDTTEYEPRFEDMPPLDDDEFLRGLEEALESFALEGAESDVTLSDGYEDLPMPAVLAPMGAHETDHAVGNVEQEELAHGVIDTPLAVLQDEGNALVDDVEGRHRSGNIPLPAEVAAHRQTLEDAVVETLQLTVVPRPNSRVLKWGAFVITHKPLSSSWQIACPWHARSVVTGCRKSVTCGAIAEDVTAHVNSVKMLILWARAARDHDRQRWHLIHPLPAANELPSTDILLTYKADMSAEPEPGTVVDDETMDNLGAAVAAAKPKAKTKAKAKAEGKAKHKPGAKPKGRGGGLGKGRAPARGKGKAKGNAAHGSSSGSSTSSSSSRSSTSSSS
eukprot:2202380-Amphidinium_carterae.5